MYVIEADTAAVRKALTGLPKELRRELRAPLKASGELVRAEMLRRVPRASGRLAKGVKTRVDLRSLKVRVLSTARAEWRSRGVLYDYGRAIEFDAKRYGTRYKWFYPSWDATRDVAVKLYEKAVDDALVRVGLK